MRLLQVDGWRRDKLHQLIAHFRRGAEQLGLELMPSESAIQPIILGESQKAMQASATLLKQGIWVSAIRPPTVAQGSARLRITFSAAHDIEHVDQLLGALAGISQ